ncbi:MAG: hypothetical protein JXO22_06880 [Phycisphaerae bacterium]|nr:hypothetical protein [Phycisphaerae bacterium]
MRWVALLGLLVGMGLTVGCATLAKTDKEVVNTFAQTCETDMLMMSHSWNYFWLADRQMRLSEWHMR